jgi:hypothetical protein
MHPSTQDSNRNCGSVTLAGNDRWTVSATGAISALEKAATAGRGSTLA